MYPLFPKSTKNFKVGQFWPIELKSGKFACGVVLSIVFKSNGKRDSRTFLAGLLDWCGPEIPNEKDIHGKTIVKKGFAHIKSITETGSRIVNEMEPEWSIPTEMEECDDIRTWGYNVINILAEKHFG